MQNRRSTYRYPFRPGEAPLLKLVQPDGITELAGTVQDLSLGGMKVSLPRTAGPLHVDDEIVARLLAAPSLPNVPLDMVLPARVRYQVVRADGISYGVSFLLEAVTPANDRRERDLARFLAEAQRRRRARSLP